MFNDIFLCAFSPSVFERDPPLLPWKETMRSFVVAVQLKKEAAFEGCLGSGKEFCSRKDLRRGSRGHMNLGKRIRSLTVALHLGPHAISEITVISSFENKGLILNDV